MARPEADGILALLRAQGGRVTSGRRSILEALLGRGGHVTAETLTAEVQASRPDIHESTVYRFLDELERLGVVDHVHLGHGPAVYHLASDAHHHLVCEGCGKVVEVPEEVFEDLRRHLRDDFGFDVQPRHFAVTGRCRECPKPDGPERDCSEPAASDSSAPDTQAELDADVGVPQAGLAL